MNKKYWSLAIILLIVISCDSKSSKDLIGMWSIDTIRNDNTELLYKFKSNLIYFNKDKTCNLPPSGEGYYNEGKWQIEKKDSTLFLTINAEDNNLSGTYEILFWKDYENKLFKITLTNDDLKIICRKGFYNFDKSKDAF